MSIKAHVYTKALSTWSWTYLCVSQILKWNVNVKINHKQIFIYIYIWKATEISLYGMKDYIRNHQKKRNNNGEGFWFKTNKMLLKVLNIRISMHIFSFINDGLKWLG